MQVAQRVDRSSGVAEILAALALLAATSCSGASSHPDPAKGGQSATGGAPSSGGSSGAAAGNVSRGGFGSGGEAGAGQGGVSSGGSANGGSVSAGGANGGSTSGGSANGGTSGGAASGGAASGGAATSGGSKGDAGSPATGGVSTAGAAGGGGAGAGGSAGQGGAAAASLKKDAEGLFTSTGLTLISYGGYLNGESFQQDGIVTYKGYQYAAFWNTNRNVVLARRLLPAGAWEKFDFTDYTNTEADAHNTISLGISPGDGSLHLAFDHHGSNLHYRKSVAGVVGEPAAATWSAASFAAVTSSLVGTTAVAQVTYPRFVTEPGGSKLLFGARIGTSGSGDEYLWEYDAASRTWASLGKYIDGITDNINAYPHGLSYTRGGTRLHVSWCWRETPDATTNHDLLYAYSDDNGRTWKNNAGTTVATTGSSFMSLRSNGISVFSIGQNRGLINQEHMAVDSAGRVHVLLSHMPDSAANDSNFENARKKSQFFHYVRDTNGSWRKAALGLPVVANFRGKLAISASNNVYAILPDLRIAGASAAQSFTDWSLLDSSDTGRFFSDPLIDSARLLLEDKLTVYYPQKGSPNIYTLDYTLR